MKKVTVGILAHVDAGKTTLAEALLYQSGKLRKLGRVDHGDTLMDTHTLERERGITIFASQAVITTPKLEITLLDTPGHVDFSAETERTLQVLDYAILVISGTDGVQAHTRTLWKLLKLYNIPTFVFVTKMDLARKTRQELIAELQEELTDGCVDFSDLNTDSLETLASLREDVLDQYLESGTISDESIAQLIRQRLAFPCIFGSGLKLLGVDELINCLERYTLEFMYPSVFGAKVFKITHDEKSGRLTHLKVTGGSIKVRDIVQYDGLEEKISQIRVYSGTKFETREMANSGDICAVLGLTATKNGQGLGKEAASDAPVLEPVMNYRIKFPAGVSNETALAQMRKLEEEDPQLKITWNEHLKEIHVGLMGEVQTEILKSIIAERFGMDVEIDSGRVMYKETIEDTVEGVGHFEPLRHYAEVHLILEPLEAGSGIVFGTKCSEDALDRNWQRLILGHLAEKQHLGVLTGSPITDIKITLASGRAHLKHTEGGDFRQATYRAVRQGLMQAKTKLLEPYYSFVLEIPPEQLGRAINDIRARYGKMDNPEDAGGFMRITGTAPVTALNGYAAEVAAYTGGRGRFSCIVSGYDECRNTESVVNDMSYDPEADLENTPDSVFCAHGGGFTVKWDKVKEYMHLESCMAKEEVYIPKVNHRNLRIDEKELEAIMEREFGPMKHPLYRAPKVTYEEDKEAVSIAAPKTKWYIVDGYNVIFAWDDLSKIAEDDMDAARARLMDILCNYSAFTGSKMVLVFDAYKVAGGQGRRFDYHNIKVVYTKENETGDMYIEKLVADIGKNELVRVVTSDGLIQLSALRSGVLRVSAMEFEREADAVSANIDEFLKELKGKR